MRRYWIFVLVVVVLVALVAVGDRVALTQVEQQVAQRLQSQLALAEQPTVVVGGVPFLTQVVTNRFTDVELSGRGVPAGTPERPLEVDRLDVELSGVRTADWFSRISAEQLGGSAKVTWEEISEQVGAVVTPQDAGRVRVDITADLYGQQVPFIISARPVLDVASQEVHLSEPQVVVATYRVPDEVVERVAAESIPPVDLSLPLGLSANDLQVTDSHLDLGLHGTHVQLVD